MVCSQVMDRILHVMHTAPARTARRREAAALYKRLSRLFIRLDAHDWTANSTYNIQSLRMGRRRGVFQRHGLKSGRVSVSNVRLGKSLMRNRRLDALEA
jgi:hypothetical protein